MAEERLRSALPLAVRRPLFGMLGGSIRRPTGRRASCAAGRRSRRWRAPLSKPYFHSMSIVRDDNASAAVLAEFERRLGGYRAIDVFHHHASVPIPTIRMSLDPIIDLQTYLWATSTTK